MKVPKSLEKYGLEAPEDNVEGKHLVMTCEGETGVGKSDFFIRSAPDPLLVINLDRNLKGMIEKYADRDILVKHIRMPKFDKKQKGPEQQARDMDLLQEILDLYMDALECGDFKSIMIDTGDALYELARRGILGGGLEFGDAKRTDFAPVNAFMKAFFDEAKSNPVNFLMTLHMKDEYKGANSTGNRTRSGWKGSIQCSQCHVALSKDMSESGLDKFLLHVVKCTINTDVEGQTLQGKEISFKMLQDLVYG